MELNFDNEIDALLRQTAKGESVVKDGVVNSSHLDADEISAFAENALPETAKQFYMAHLADCDVCRKKLSSLILLNAEAGIENTYAEKSEIISPAIPWYRKLTAFPNLVYTMGALVVVFSGIIAFTVLQNVSSPQSSSDVSKVIERKDQINQTANSNSNVAVEGTYSNSTNSSFNTSANTALSSNSTAVPLSNVVANSAANKATAPVLNPKPEPKKPEAVTSETPQTGSQPQDDALAYLKDKKDAPASRSESAGSVPEKKSETKKENESQAETVDVVKSAPSQSKVRELPVNGRSTNQISPSPKSKKPSEPNTETTTVGGKNFRRENNVWYDTTYSGQSTINITRGTKEYQKLDKGLRGIVENLGGTIVVVWKSKAYRFQ